MATKLIFNGTRTDEPLDLEKVIGELNRKRKYLHSLQINDILDFFHTLSEYWEQEQYTKKYRYLKNISDFLHKANLTNRLSIALHKDIQSLDQFVDLDDAQFLFHAQPRGLTVHWLAGNVSILGLFSIFSSLITKNVALVKASSKGYEELVDFIMTIREVNTSKIKGEEFAETIRIILVDREDKDIHLALSKAADVRIAWGGHEAIQTIINLEKKLSCEDIIFGPKYSYAAIDKETLDSEFTKTAQRLAIDVSVFDQYACSSPHTVFVQEGAHSALEFAQELAKQLDFVQRSVLPKQKIDSGKSMEILNLRTQYMFKGKVFPSKGTEWTVIYSEEDGLADACFSRVIHVKPIKDLMKLKEFNTRQRQTLGIAFTKENKLKLLDQITLYGVDRCPDLGYLTFFESPWDGMFVFDRLVRWITTYK